MLKMACQTFFQETQKTKPYITLRILKDYFVLDIEKFMYK